MNARMFLHWAILLIIITTMSTIYLYAQLTLLVSALVAAIYLIVKNGKAPWKQ